MGVVHSPFLTTVETAAKQLEGASSAALTYDRFFAAAIRCIFLDPPKGGSEAEIKEVEASAETLKKFAGENANWKKIYRALLSNISGAENELMGSLQMKKALLKTEDQARSAGIQTLSCDMVMRVLLVTSPAPLKDLLIAEETDSFDAPESSSIFEQADIPAKKSGEKEAEDHRKKTISQLSKRVKVIRDSLLGTVFGQDHAVSIFSAGYFQAELLAITDQARTRPRATYLFAGPPGVGKTFLAEKAAEVLGLPFMRFDMSEYADKEANIEFCGSDKVYKNGKPGNVTSFVEENPTCVLLFDEIEKANVCVIHLFLQLLDAGRLRDNYTDHEVSFKDTIIILTTNAGKQLYADSDTGNYSGTPRKVILNALARDVDPRTGLPYFPAAICSRFASGNVVMFNHMSAHDLRSIAKREIMRHAANFEQAVGIHIDIDENVFTALLLSEGGNVDARTIRARSESFFDDELYELFRLLSSDKEKEEIDVEKISIQVVLPTDSAEIEALFIDSKKSKVLVFASDELSAMCIAKANDCTVLTARSVDEAIALIKDNDIRAVLIDPMYGKYSRTSKYLNIEDVESKARDLFWYVKEQFHDIPIYILLSSAALLSEEEKLSLTKAGARGFVPISNDPEDSFSKELDKICEGLHQQESVQLLARMNKALSFETSQLLSAKGKKAEIHLFDFELTACVDAEDRKNVLSNVSKPDVKFDQVLGAADAKKELQYFVEYLKNPKKYLGTGVRAPRGILLYGPPGTGKTMLAKAMASESGVTFIASEGNQFLKQYVGEGQQAVHELFLTARKYAPSILFIDEIDAIAKERRGVDNGAEATLTAFLTEMDGFKNDPSKPVFVLAATNFDVEPGTEKSLDPALMRRFDRRVYIDLPTKEDRIKYLQMQMEQNQAIHLSQNQIGNIAMRSTGMSLAELESIVELALRSAIRANSEIVTDEIFEEAFETFNSGDVKKWDESQLERIARHETGHAFLCWHSGETPSYLTIVARGNHGGYMQHADNEGKAIFTKEELLAKIRTSLGGRAAEIVYYGDKDGMSTGASGDFQSATRLAQQIVCSYGMDDEFGLAVIDSQAYHNGDLSSEVRAAVNRILSAEMKNAIDIIAKNKEKLDAMVTALMEKNHLNKKEIEDVFSKNRNL